MDKNIKEIIRHQIELKIKLMYIAMPFTALVCIPLYILNHSVYSFYFSLIILALEVYFVITTKAKLKKYDDAYFINATCLGAKRKLVVAGSYDFSFETNDGEKRKFVISSANKRKYKEGHDYIIVLSKDSQRMFSYENLIYVYKVADETKTIKK